MGRSKVYLRPCSVLKKMIMDFVKDAETMLDSSDFRFALQLYTAFRVKRLRNGLENFIDNHHQIIHFCLTE
jgi:hypothetical protein